MPSTISDLPALTLPVVGTDLLVVVRGGVAYKVAASDLAQYVTTEESIVPVSEPFRGALVRLAASWTGIPSWPGVIAWTEEVYDTDAFWALGAPTRLTVPAGVSKVRLIGGANFEALATAGSISLEVLKNGAALPVGGPSFNMRAGATGSSENAASVVSPVLPVTGGDYFELQATASMSGQDQILTGKGTYFGIEVVEMLP